MASAVNFSGIASGIDTNGLIDAELASDRSTRITPLETKVSELNDTTSVLTTLQTKLKTLQTKLRAYSSLSTGAVLKTGISSDETVSTATAVAGTSNAAYSLSVTQLATSGKMTVPSGATTYAGSSTALGIVGAGNLKFNIGTSTVTVAVTSATTVADFVNSFNAAAGSSATSTMVNVGTTELPAYKVLINNANTGLTAGKVELDGTSTATGFTHTDTAGQNSIVSITGVGTSIQRASNNISDIIPGVTFNLKAAGSAQISVTNDSASTLTSVKEFVKLYNDVITTINDNNTIQRDESTSTVKNIFGVLAKTTTDDNVLSSLRAGLASISYALTDSGGTPTNSIVNFSSMGITTDASTYDSEGKTGGGVLKIDESIFLSALSSEPNSVNQLLTKFADKTSLTAEGGNLINNFVKSGGILEISINSNNDQVRTMNLRIADIETQLKNKETSLRQRYAAFESLTGRLQQQGASLTSALKGL